MGNSDALDKGGGGDIIISHDSIFFSTGVGLEIACQCVYFYVCTQCTKC